MDFLRIFSELLSESNTRILCYVFFTFFKDYSTHERKAFQILSGNALALNTYIHVYAYMFYVLQQCVHVVIIAVCLTDNCRHKALNLIKIYYNLRIFLWVFFFYCFALRIEICLHWRDILHNASPWR